MARIRRFRARTRLSPLAEASRLSRYGLMIGTDRDRGDVKCYAPLDWLLTHIHVLGPTRSGKTRWMTWLFQILASYRQSTTIVIDPKGDLYDLAWRTIARTSLASRAVLLDPGSDRIIGYNPLRPNGLPLEIHAKAVRESVTAGWGQGADLDHTPQLARCLYYSLAVAREMELTFVEALQVLYPSSPLRRALLPRLRSAHLRQALAELDALPERRQEELVASTIARLEPFVADPMIARMFTQQARSLDLSEVVRRPHLVLINLAKFRPLRETDVKLLGRLIVNDIVAHVFQRGSASHPVFLLVDEVHDVATRDFCAALDWGSGLGLHVVAAHQHLHQLRDEEKTGYLYRSVMTNARTKVVFGGLSFEDLRVMAEQCFLGQFDPLAVKNELTTLECEPVESTREVPTRTRTLSWNLGVHLGIGSGSSVSESRSETRGTSRHSGMTRGRGSSRTSGTGHGTAISVGEADGASERNLTTEGSFDSETESESETLSEAQGEHRASSVSNGESTSTTHSFGVGGGIGGTAGTSVATVPFIEHRKRRVVSSRTYWTWEEFVLRNMRGPRTPAPRDLSPERTG